MRVDRALRRRCVGLRSFETRAQDDRLTTVSTLTTHPVRVVNLDRVASAPGQPLSGGSETQCARARADDAIVEQAATCETLTGELSD
jgi:hypothetical protein